MIIPDGQTGEYRQLFLVRVEHCGLLQTSSLSKVFLALGEVTCDGARTNCAAGEGGQVFP